MSIPEVLFAQSRTNRISRYLKIADSLRVVAEFKAAKSYYNKALKLNSKSTRAYDGLSEIAFEKEKWGDVIKWNQKILKMNPGELTAHYNLGRAYRERGKFKALLFRKLDFDKSKKHFLAVIQSDSTFLDVFFQYANLQFLRENWTEAIELAHRQVVVKPDLVRPRVGLYQFYRSYLNNKNVNKIAQWLKTQNNDWSRYFKGEIARRQQKFAQADSVFKDLLSHELNISSIPVYLALVRSHIQQVKPAVAEDFFIQALNEIHSEVDAEFFFEDSKYVFTEKEWQQYTQLNQAEEKRDFFRQFWLSRNPVPAMKINYRILEHFKRLIIAESNYWFDGVRSPVNNPDRVSLLRFPETYFLNKEFNDKGLIYLRHGEPNDVAKTAGPGVPSNETWLYYETPFRPKQIFHFLIGQYATGNNWRLVPILTDRRMLEDRLGMDYRLDRLYVASTSDRFNNTAEFDYEIQEEVFNAMSTDFHTWDKKIAQLELFYHVANFKGANGKVRTEIFYGIPTHQFKTKKHASSNSVEIEYGAAFINTQLHEQTSSFEQISFDFEDSVNNHHDIFLYHDQFELVPGQYDVSFYARQNQRSRLGGYNFQTSIPQFSVNQLEMSDLVLAYKIQTESTHPLTSRRQVSILANPTQTFELTEPVFVYFEIYNLVKDPSGQTSFEIENEIAQVKKKKNLLQKVFRISPDGRKNLISIKESLQSELANMVEFVGYDVNNLKKGEYELKIKITDLLANKSISKTIALELR
ncbi:MAG: GWxTD domain-containing protein [bacterium]